MKTSRIIFAAAICAALASCQKDFAPEANLGAEVDYRLEVSATELGVTRAGDTAEDQEAKDSAFGAIDYLDGAVVSKDTVIELADIPSKEVLIAKLLGSIKSPLYGLAYALQAVVDRDGEAAPAEEAAE